MMIHMTHAFDQPADDLAYSLHIVLQYIIFYDSYKTQECKQYKIIRANRLKSFKKRIFQWQYVFRRVFDFTSQ